MILERMKSEGVAHNSYLIGSESNAAVIDPRPDCQIYIDLAQQHGLKIKYTFETHRNEDYVIGSVELNNFTGAEIYHGPGLDWKCGNTLRDSHVGYLEQRLAEVPGDKPVAVICKVGHRAGLGASILLRAGYKEVYNVLGSVKARVAAGFPTTSD